MKNNLVLIGENDNLVVERFKLGNKTVEFVHNVENGLNYFTQKSMASMLGLTKHGVSYSCNKYEEQLNNLSSNTGLNVIKLKTSNKGRRTKFYSFDGLTYVVYRSNSDKAMEVRNFISQTLNTMFNVATGKTDIDTNIKMEVLV